MEDFFKALRQGHPVYWYCPNGKENGFTARELDGGPDIEWARKHPKGIGVYFVVNELGDKKNDKGNLRHEGNVIRPLASFADFDEGTEEEQVAKIADSPLEPSAIVRSGRGYHLYWFLDGTSKQDLDAWRLTQVAIAKFFNTDDSVKDLPRLMRLPGSWHTKDGERLVTLERCDPDTRYTMPEMLEAFPAAKEDRRTGNWMSKLAEVTPEGKRNTTVTSVIGGLLRRLHPTVWETVGWPLAKAYNRTQMSPPDDEAKVRGSFDSIAKAEMARRRTEDKGVKVWTEEDTQDVSRYDGETATVVLRDKEGEAHFVFTEIEHGNSHELEALLSVEFRVPGSYPNPFTAKLNVLALSARSTFARELQSLGDGPNWRMLLNRACEIFRRQIQSHDTSLDLRTVTVTPPKSLFYPFLSEGTANILFGDGGTGKTFIALRMAISLATGVEFAGFRPNRIAKVLFVDYEDTPETAHWRILQLCRPYPTVNTDDAMCAIRYWNPGGRPITSVLPALRRVIKEHGAELVIIDSVSSASGDSLVEDKTPSRYFNAVQNLGVTTLSLAHVAKGTVDAADQNYAFGSIQWHNLARNAWNVRGEPEVQGDELADFSQEKAKQLGFFHRKCNNGPLHRPIPMRVVYGAEYQYVRYEEGSLGFWEQNLKTPERILRLLKTRNMTRVEIDKAMEGTAKDTIKKALLRLGEQGLIFLDGGQGGYYKRQMPQKSDVPLPDIPF